MHNHFTRVSIATVITPDSTIGCRRLQTSLRDSPRNQLTNTTKTFILPKAEKQRQNKGEKEGIKKEGQ
jgi:hypothetical protein